MLCGTIEVVYCAVVLCVLCVDVISLLTRSLIVVYLLLMSTDVDKYVNKRITMIVPSSR